MDKSCKDPRKLHGPIIERTDNAKIGMMVAGILLPLTAIYVVALLVFGR